MEIHQNNSSDDLFEESERNRPPLHPFTLSFFPDAVNRLFENYATDQSVGFARLTLALAIFLYFLFAFLDPLISPDVAGEITLIRVASVVFFSAVILMTYTAWGIKNFQFLMNVVVLFAGAGIITMILISGSSVYYAALILAVIYAHSLLRLRFIYASFSTWIVILFYLFTASWFQIAPFEIYLNNLFFLFSANVMGMFASYWLEYYMRAVFWKEQILRDKTQTLKREDLRKSQELEQARKIQLAMLPQALPQYPGYLFSFSMNPASEVGGDYYDYQINDGQLTFGIGDATGHGLQASVIVTAIKLVFSEHAGKMDIVDFLKRASNSISLMGIKNVYLAFAIGRLRNHTLELAGAGIPSALIYRCYTKSVEQFPLKGLPLGSKTMFPYKKERTILHPGDIVLLMTDGFPELMNGNGVMFGYQNVIEIFRELADLNPKELLEQMQHNIYDWLQGAEQNDDITFFAFKRMPVVSD